MLLVSALRIWFLYVLLWANVERWWIALSACFDCWVGCVDLIVLCLACVLYYLIASLLLGVLTYST